MKERISIKLSGKIKSILNYTFVFLFLCSFMPVKAEVNRNAATENQQSSIVVSGNVKDNNGETMIGVSVLVKGTSVGVVTNLVGDFTVEVPYVNASLIFSYVGFQPQEIPLEGRKTLNVILIEDSKALEEVVVIGYTTQKKATITGSIATITTKDLQQSPTANITNALAGRMPGLMVNQFMGGEPGVDRSDINIRGFATYGDKSPIIIVDGVERDMNYLSSEEIETFTILKDASATAPFGVRGANGVIIVTTKRGKAQEKADVNFKASFGTNSPVKFPNYLGSADYAMLYNEAWRNDNPNKADSELPLFTQQAIDNFRIAKGDNSDGLGYNWDYFDYAFKPGNQQEYSLSIRGGSNRARYYIMANFFNQSGNYSHTNLSAYNTQAVFKRYNFRSNIDVDITDNFYTKLDIAARITDRNAPGTTANRIVQIANTQAPYLPIILDPNDDSANENFTLYNPLGLLYGDQFNRYNLLGELSRTGFLNEKNTYLNGSFALGHKLDFITSGLKIEGVFSYDASEGRWINRVVNTYSEGYRTYPGYATFTPLDGANIFMDPAEFGGHYTGPYKTGNKYEIDQTIGNGFSHNDAISKTYYQLKLDYLRSFGMHDVTGLVLFNRSTFARNNEVEFRYQGITARATYAYASRYLAEFNVGYNGSENFAKGKRYGLFPAMSLGWVISEEPFMDNTRDWLSNLKIRGSYGLVGSDKISASRFSYLQYFERDGNYNFGQTFGSGASAGVREGSLANPSLSWEKSQKLNIGIDASLFKQKLNIVFDFFKEHRYDIFTNLGDGDKLGFPDIAGANAPWINSGIVDNFGFDFEIGWRGKIGRNFIVNVRPNFTFARNKIIFMNEIPRDFEWTKRTGSRIGEQFVYVFDHFIADQNEANQLNSMNDGTGFQPWGRLIPGDVVYKDLNNDGKINELGDVTSMNYPRTPEIQFGLPVTLQYKGIDFSFLFHGSTNSSLQLNGPAVYDFPFIEQDMKGKVKNMHLNRWTPETAATATYPALHWGDNPNNKNTSSSLFLYDASYVRLKNVEIGYSLPKRSIKFAGFQNVRIYAQGMNLITFDKLRDVDVDPETGSGNGSWYPVQRIFTFGIDVTY